MDGIEVEPGLDRKSSGSNECSVEFAITVLPWRIHETSTHF
jgi:hypothetical protein